MFMQTKAVPGKGPVCNRVSIFWSEIGKWFQEACHIPPSKFLGVPSLGQPSYGVFFFYVSYVLQLWDHLAVYFVQVSTSEGQELASELKVRNQDTYLPKPVKKIWICQLNKQQGCKTAPVSFSPAMQGTRVTTATSQRRLGIGMHYHWTLDVVKQKTLLSLLQGSTSLNNCTVGTKTAKLKIHAWFHAGANKDAKMYMKVFSSSRFKKCFQENIHLDFLDLPQ